MRNQSRSARERILDTASELFYRHGFQAVGIDTIIAEAQVAKMTLYRHFGSKDDLIVAYLERANQQFWGWIDAATAAVTEPRARLIAIFEVIGTQATQPQCLGCTFQSTAAEFPALDSPVHQAALAHKQAVYARFQELATAADLHDPAALADQLLLLMDGAWVASRMFGPDNPARHLVQAAKALIAAHG